MSDDFEDEDEELFNDDFDDTDTVLRTGVAKHACPNGHGGLKFRVEGRFVVRYCDECGHEEED